jgi:hypothetical protein
VLKWTKASLDANLWPQKFQVHCEDDICFRSHDALTSLVQFMYAIIARKNSNNIDLGHCENH